MRILLILCLLQAEALAQVPREAERYRRDLTANARLVWGLQAPVASLAAQVHQESGWRPDAKSKFANGLAQFTPATADWIDDLYPELGPAQPFNPAWALRALVRYDRHLWERVKAATGCDRMAFALAAYNGGLGWINREKREAALRGLDSMLWWRNVESICLRADWACRENRDYPKRILQLLERRYSSWGEQSCAS